MIYLDLHINFIKRNNFLIFKITRIQNISLEYIQSQNILFDLIYGPFLQFINPHLILRNGFLWARLNCKLIGLFRNINNITVCIETIKDLLKQEDQIKCNFKQSTDLLHIGVLVCFITDDTNSFLELFSSESFLEVVPTIEPYSLYYYALALLLNQQFIGNANLAIIGINEYFFSTYIKIVNGVQNKQFSTYSQLMLLEYYQIQMQNRQ